MESYRCYHGNQNSYNGKLASTDFADSNVLMQATSQKFNNRKVHERPFGRSLEEYSARADKLRAEGADMGPVPAPTPVPEARCYIYTRRFQRPFKQIVEGVKDENGMQARQQLHGAREREAQMAEDQRVKE